MPLRRERLVIEADLRQSVIVAGFMCAGIILRGITTLDFGVSSLVIAGQVRGGRINEPQNDPTTP